MSRTTLPSNGGAPIGLGWVHFPLTPNHIEYGKLANIFDNQVTESPSRSAN